jgi:hypothetical protein
VVATVGVWLKAVIAWLVTSGMETVEVVVVTSEALTVSDGSLSSDHIPRTMLAIENTLKIESRSLSENVGARTNLPLGIRIMFDIVEKLHQWD